MGISIHAPAKERPLSGCPADPELSISIHAPAKERLTPYAAPTDVSDFNPRSREGATWLRCNPCFCIVNFNPRSREGATQDCPHHVSVKQFQSTLPRRSDGVNPEEVLRLKKFQSTLPRRSDFSGEKVSYRYGISIHAPAKERQQM